MDPAVVTATAAATVAAVVTDTMDIMAVADTMAAIVAKREAQEDKRLRCMARPFCFTCNA